VVDNEKFTCVAYGLHTVQVLLNDVDKDTVREYDTLKVYFTINKKGYPLYIDTDDIVISGGSWEDTLELPGDWPSATGISAVSIHLFSGDKEYLLFSWF